MGAPPQIRLDYGDTEPQDRLLVSLSAVSEADGFLWTASDEGRTLQCLKPDGYGGYCLKQHYKLDTRFSLPDERDADDKKAPEADIESLSVAEGYLWICGSHCHVRRDAGEKILPPDQKLRTRPSRCLFGRIKLNGGGDIEPKGEHLPYEGPGSLRQRLSQEPLLARFLELPSKENGLDIEGITALERGSVFLGLRGPVIRGCAIVLEARADEIFDPKSNLTIHFLNLDGLGVRDLTHDGDDILILAGPVGVLNGPFRIYHWRPKDAGSVQNPKCLHQWPIKVRGNKARSASRGTLLQDEHPEAVCWFKRKDGLGLIVLYDNPEVKGRIKKQRRYLADWIPHERYR